MEKVKGKREEVKGKELVHRLGKNKLYFEQRITALNRRACLHEGEHCGVRARQEITGMLCVLNALGYEAVGDWTRYDGEFELVPAEDLAAKKEGGAK